MLTPLLPTDWLYQLEENSPAARLHQLDNQLHQHHRQQPTLKEWVIGHHSILLRFETPHSQAQVEQLLQTVSQIPHQESPSNHHDIFVNYDGPDLTAFAELCRLSTDQLIHLHSKPTYRVRFLGFAPGFAYLDGLPQALHQDRRDQPRPRIDAGAIAVGGPHAGIYPIPSPGGWHWLGNTETKLFHPDRPQEPLQLHPNDTLKFHPL